MKHYLLLPLMLAISTIFSMEYDDHETTLVVAAWGTTEKKQLSSEYAEFIVKNQHGNCSVKYKNLPKGIIMPLPVGPSDMATVPWSTKNNYLITLVHHDEGIVLVLHKNAWYKHPALTHSAIALTAILITYVAC